jgi:hypothetical protein
MIKNVDIKMAKHDRGIHEELASMTDSSDLSRSPAWAARGQTVVAMNVSLPWP